MRTVPLQKICDLQIGKTPSRSVPEYWDGDLPWVTISDFAAGRIVTTTHERITRIGAAKSGSKRIPRGTLLLSFKLSLGKRAFAGCDLFTNEAIAALHVLDHDVADRGYLYWALGSLDYDRLVDRAAKGKTLNKAKLKILRIPLPPLAEQKRIAEILDAADALRAQRRETLAQLDTLLQSTFLDMFGDPVTNPMGWPPTSLSAISDELRDGPFGSNLKSSHYVESGVRVIRLQNIGVGEMRNDDLAFISEEHFASLPHNHCQPGDVIIGTMGDPNLRACIVPLALARALNKADCILMRGDRTKVDASYVCWFLNNPSTVSMALRLVRGQTRGRISLGRMKNLQITLPPLDIQHRFAAIVESVEQQKASQRAHLAELDTLFASLQSRAFRGDL